MTRYQIILEFLTVLFIAIGSIAAIIGIPQVQEFLKSNEWSIVSGVINVVLSTVFRLQLITFAIIFYLVTIYTFGFNTSKHTIKKFTITMCENSTVRKGDVVNLEMIAETERTLPMTGGFLQIVIVAPYERTMRYFDYPRQSTEPEKGDLYVEQNGRKLLRTSLAIPKNAEPGITAS